MMAMPDLQRYPLNLNLIPIVKDVVVILTQMFLILIISPLLLKSKKCASHHTITKISSLKKKNMDISFILYQTKILMVPL